MKTLEQLLEGKYPQTIEAVERALRFSKYKPFHTVTAPQRVLAMAEAIALGPHTTTVISLIALLITMLEDHYKEQALKSRSDESGAGLAAWQASHNAGPAPSSVKDREDIHHDPILDPSDPYEFIGRVLLKCSHSWLPPIDRRKKCAKCGAIRNHPRPVAPDIPPFFPQVKPTPTPAIYHRRDCDCEVCRTA